MCTECLRFIHICLCFVATAIAFSRIMLTAICVKNKLHITCFIPYEGELIAKTWPPFCVYMNLWHYSLRPAFHIFTQFESYVRFPALKNQTGPSKNAKQVWRSHQSSIFFVFIVKLYISTQVTSVLSPSKNIIQLFYAGSHNYIRISGSIIGLWHN